MNDLIVRFYFMTNGHVDDQIIEFRRRIDNFYCIDYHLGSDFDT